MAGLRIVAQTRSPAAVQTCASARPIPVLQPVMSTTYMSNPPLFPATVARVNGTRAMGFGIEEHTSALRDNADDHFRTMARVVALIL